MTTVTITDIGTDEVTIPVSDTSDIIVQTLSDGPPLGNYIADHSLATNLTADDHPQYLNITRGDARYASLSHEQDTTIHYEMSDILINMDQITNSDGTIYSAAEQTKLAGIETGAQVNNLTASSAGDLTDGTSNTLHYHNVDRDRANHTGTQELNSVINSNTINTPTVDNSLETILSSNLSSGILDTISISHIGSGVLNLPGVNFFVRDNNLGSGVIYIAYVDANTSSITVSDNTSQYVYIDYNLGSPVWGITADASVINQSDKVLAAVCSRMGSLVKIVEVGNDIVDSNAKYYKKSYFKEGFFKASGGIVSSPSGLEIACTEGKYWFGLSEYTISALANTDTFTYYYYNGTNWLSGASTALNGTQWNDTTTGLATLTTGYYCNHWIYASFGAGVGDTNYGVVYGQQEHSSLKAAREEAAISLLPSSLEKLGVLVGVVTVAENTGTIVDVRNLQNLKYIEEISTLIPKGTPLAADSGIPGEIRWDTANLYICVGDGGNNWKKVALGVI